MSSGLQTTTTRELRLITSGVAVRGGRAGKTLKNSRAAELDVARVRLHVFQSDPFPGDQLDPDLEGLLVLVENVDVGDGAGEQEHLAGGKGRLAVRRRGERLQGDGEVDDPVEVPAGKGGEHDGADKENDACQELN